VDIRTMQKTKAISLANKPFKSWYKVSSLKQIIEEIYGNFIELYLERLIGK
jgi:hypothetical protein